MAKQLTLVDLGEDILHIVFSLLHADSNRHLLALRITSRLCRTLVDPLLYRALELREVRSRHEATQATIHRLLDPSDDLSRHVRVLKITIRNRNHRRGYGGDVAHDSEEEVAAGHLETIIGKLYRLQWFRWDVNRDIPPSIMSKLEEHWPNVKLSVKNHDRLATDRPSLSSPLLHSLSFCILNHTATVVATDQLEQFSKLPTLREILLESSNLRKLGIKFEYNWMPRQVKWRGNEAVPRLLNLPLESTDQLPPLEELTFSGPTETYEFDLKHCQLLRQCMDWSHLRRLDLGLSCPQHFFEEIGSSLKSLESLTMGIRAGSRRYTHWRQGPLTCDTLEPVVTFLESIPELLELNIIDLSPAVVEFASVILDRHMSLRALSYHTSINRSGYDRYRNQPGRDDACGWLTAQLDILREQCRDLSHLEIDFPLAAGKWPIDYAETLATFSRLHSLKVFVKLGVEASDFASGYRQDAMGSVPMPSLNLDLARKVTIGLFRSFFSNDPYARILSLEICFKHKLVEDRGQNWEVEWPIKIQRLERDDAPSPLDGGFTIKSAKKWLYV